MSHGARLSQVSLGSRLGSAPIIRKISIGIICVGLASALPNYHFLTIDSVRFDGMASKASSLLKQFGTKLLRVGWCDNANIIRAKAIYCPNKNLEMVLKEGVALVKAAQTLPVMYDVVAPEGGIGPVGEVRLIPAWETLRILPYAKGHASVMADMYTLDGEPSEICPRNFLKRMIAEAAECGFQVQAAFENEFNLLKPGRDGKNVPVDSTIYAETFAMDTSCDVLLAICDALTQQGLTIEQYYPESASGQHEISIRHCDALTAATEQIVFRETVKAVAMKHNVVASFMPKIFPSQAGNGTHLHISLHKNDGTNIIASDTTPGELSPTASHFIAGILHHLPALMAITVPSTNSYRRLQPCTWSGNYRCWGYVNRECAVRVPLNPSKSTLNPSNFELKASDATSNPYLSLGSVIAAGIDGVRCQLPIPPPVDVDPGHLSEDELHRMNIEMLPSSLKDAIDALSGNEVLLKALQPQLSKALLGVRMFEYESMKDMSLEEEVELLLQRY